MTRPSTTLILAMTADGKIADRLRSPARFSSQEDLAHLQKQVAQADGVLFGAGTLRAYGTTMSVSKEELRNQRLALKKPVQPVQIVASASANIDRDLRFFSQQVPRWLLTSSDGASVWQDTQSRYFDEIIIAEKDNQKDIRSQAIPETSSCHPEPREGYHQNHDVEKHFCQRSIDWSLGLKLLLEKGVNKLAILGGGNLAASLLAFDLIDEFWLTVCPVILGGVDSPTPVEGLGFLASYPMGLELLSVEKVAQEVFLHYRRIRGPSSP